MNRFYRLSLLILCALMSACTRQTADLNGLWDGTIVFEESPVDFPLEIAVQGKQASGALFNGNERVPSTGGHFDGRTLVLRFDYHKDEMRATLENGMLKGTWHSRVKGRYSFPVEFRRHQLPPMASTPAPDISGLWILPIESPKPGEEAFRLIVRQDGQHIAAAILRVDGDTGLMKGTFRDDGAFVLNTFDGGRGLRLLIRPLPDGQLDLDLRGFDRIESYRAVRPAQAQAKGLPQPANFSTYTRVRDPKALFTFQAKTLEGQSVTSADARFQGKVLLVNVTGSWCPNCHDEAPFLVELYQRYRPLGLEIVSLSFEEEDELQNLTRVRAFIQQYGIRYTYLIAGTPEELQHKVPQAENLHVYPTTFFLGRDGRVRKVHAGFAARASAEFHEELRQEFTHTIEQLLAEPATET